MVTNSLRNKLLALTISVGLGLGAAAMPAAHASPGKAKPDCPKGQHFDKRAGQCVGHAKKKK